MTLMPQTRPATMSPTELVVKGLKAPCHYVITKYTRDQAKLLGVSVKHSTNPKKKLDVFDKDGKKIASCGGMCYSDYPTFWKNEGKAVADEHRRRYKQRHEKDRHVVGSPGYYADKLLW